MWYFCFAKPPSAAIVAHVSDDGVRLYDTEAWIIPAMDRIEEYMSLRAAASRDRKHRKQVNEWEKEQRKAARNQTRKIKLEWMAQRLEARRIKAHERAKLKENEEVKVTTDATITPRTIKPPAKKRGSLARESSAVNRKKTKRKKRLVSSTSSSEEFNLTAKRSNKLKSNEPPFKSSSIMPVVPKIVFEIDKIAPRKKIRLEEDTDF